MSMDSSYVLYKISMRHLLSRIARWALAHLVDRTVHIDVFRRLHSVNGTKILNAQFVFVKCVRVLGRLEPLRSYLPLPSSQNDRIQARISNLQSLMVCSIVFVLLFLENDLPFAAETIEKAVCVCESAGPDTRKGCMCVQGAVTAVCLPPPWRLSSRNLGGRSEGRAR